MITYGATSWSQAMEELLTEKDEGQPLYADSAYTGEEQEKSRTRVRVVRQLLKPYDGANLFDYFLT